MRNSYNDHIFHAHSNIRKHVCLVCDSTFKTWTNLKIHFRIHTGLHDFNSYIINTHVLLGILTILTTNIILFRKCKHLRIKSSASGLFLCWLFLLWIFFVGEKPFACPKCDHCSTTGGNLKQHLNKHNLSSQEIEEIMKKVFSWTCYDRYYDN